MPRRRCSVPLFLMVAGVCCAEAPVHAQRERGTLPFVVLAFDGRGDFGPETPGTKTSGWQEALDHCVKNARDLYVKGGYGGHQAIYHIEDTIRFPPAQDFRVDGGVFVINFRGADPSKDAVRIDSAMNCEYHLGLVVYGGHGAAVRIKPERPVPIDGFPVVIETQVFSQGIADPHPFSPGPRESGTGLVIDSSIAAVNYSRFYFASILNFHTCVEIGGANGFYANEFTCEHLHTNAHGSTLAAFQNAVQQNRFQFGIGVDQGAIGVTGLVMRGARNELRVAVRRGGFAPSQEIILADSAEANRLFVMADGDPLDLITDSARNPTNILSWTGPPPPARLVAGDAHRMTYQQRLYPASVEILGPDDVRARFVRGAETVDYGPSKARTLILSVSDQLELEAAGPPQLRIVPIGPP